MVSAKRLMEYEAEVWAMIREHGWMVQVVGSGEDQPGFHYSVGFTEFDRHPEVIVFGLPMVIGHVIVNDMGERVRAGERFEAGQVLDDLIAGPYKAMLIQVKDTSEHLTVANRLYRRGGKQVAALQIIVPDRDGLWPWDPQTRLTYPILGDHP